MVTRKSWMTVAAIVLLTVSSAFADAASSHATSSKTYNLEACRVKVTIPDNWILHDASHSDAQCQYTLYSKESEKEFKKISSRDPIPGEEPQIELPLPCFRVEFIHGDLEKVIDDSGFEKVTASDVVDDPRLKVGEYALPSRGGSLYKASLSNFQKYKLISGMSVASEFYRGGGNAGLVELFVKVFFDPTQKAAASITQEQSVCGNINNKPNLTIEDFVSSLQF